MEAECLVDVYVKVTYLSHKGLAARAVFDHPPEEQVEEICD
jgi:hypothetical protein